MDILILLTVAALGYAIFRQSQTNSSNNQTTGDQEDVELVTPPGYNPYILNQFQEMKDRIYSADLRENRIETKPSRKATGQYAITSDQIKLHPADSITVVYGPKHNLNI